VLPDELSTPVTTPTKSVEVVTLEPLESVAVTFKV
jgi:hypothetical protein